MNEQKSSRNVPRFTVAPTDAGVHVVEPPLADESKAEDMKAKKTKTGDTDHA